MSESAKNLLDLPPEIVSMIINHYVTVAGVKEAVRARAACKTFAVAIYSDIMSKQHPENLCSRRAKKYVKAHLAEFLERRTRAAYGVPPALLDVVNTAATTFADILAIPRQDQKSRERLTWEVSVVVAKHWEGCLILLVDRPTRKPHTTREAALEEDEPLEIYLRIAILMQHQGLVQGILQQGVSLWRGVSGFDYPVLLAVAGDNVNILFLLLNYDASRAVDPAWDDLRSKKVLKAIEIALEKGQTSVAIRMHSWHNRHVKEISTAQHGRLFKSAVEINQVSFIRRLIVGGLDKKTIRGALTTAIVYALEHGQPLVARGLADEYGHTLIRPTTSNCRNMFSAAVRFDQAAFVDLLLSTNRNPAKDQAYQQIVLTTLRLGKMVSDNILRLCIKHGLLQLEEQYRLFDKGKSALLLYWTVAKGNIELTATLLELSGKDCFGNWPPEDKVLRKAIKENHTEIVRLLLQNGFDPEGDWYNFPQSNYQLARTGSMVADLIRQAILNKKANEGSEYMVPNFLVWNVDSQKDQPVSYSLTPDEAEESEESIETHSAGQSEDEE